MPEALINIKFANVDARDRALVDLLRRGELVKHVYPFNSETSLGLRTKDVPMEVIDAFTLGLHINGAVRSDTEIS